MSYLRGDFALCLYDLQCGLFIVIRDRYSIKPLFRMIIDGELLMTAEMKAFLPFGRQPEWHINSVIDGFQLEPEKIFKNV